MPRALGFHAFGELRPRPLARSRSLSLAPPLRGCQERTHSLTLFFSHGEPLKDPCIGRDYGKGMFEGMGMGIVTATPVGPFWGYNPV